MRNPAPTVRSQSGISGPGSHGPAMEAMKAVSDYGEHSCPVLSCPVSSHLFSSLFPFILVSSSSNILPLFSFLLFLLLPPPHPGDNQLVVTGIFENYIKIKISDPTMNKVTCRGNSHSFLTTPLYVPIPVPLLVPVCTVTARCITHRGHTSNNDNTSFFYLNQLLILHPCSCSLFFFVPFCFHFPPPSSFIHPPHSPTITHRLTHTSSH